MAVIDRVVEIVTPLVESLGFSLYDVEQAGPILRISVAGSPTIDTGDLTRLTRMISSALDEADPVPGRYTLEVTSPGLERKLRTPEHFATALGVVVKLKLATHVEPRRVEGELISADADTITVQVSDGTHTKVSLDDIATARTVFVWGPQPKPGKVRGSASSARTTKVPDPARTPTQESPSRSAERSAG